MLLFQKQMLLLLNLHTYHILLFRLGFLVTQLEICRNHHRLSYAQHWLVHVLLHDIAGHSSKDLNISRLTIYGHGSGHTGTSIGGSAEQEKFKIVYFIQDREIVLVAGQYIQERAFAGTRWPHYR